MSGPSFFSELDSVFAEYSPINHSEVANVAGGTENAPRSSALSRLEEGFTLFKERHVSEAAKKFAEPIRLDGSLAEAWCNLAYCRLAHEDFDEAIADSTTAIRLSPKLAHAWQIRGLARAEQRDLDNATDFREASRLLPRFSSALHNAGVVLTQLGEFESALTELNLALATEPDSATTLYSRALALLAAGQIREAIQDLDQAVVTTPQFRDAWYQLGTCHRAVQDFLRSVEAHTQALMCDSMFALSWRARAENYHELGRFDSAISDCNHVIALQPDSVTALSGRALALAAEDQAQAAIGDLTTAITMDPSFSGAWAVRGAVRAEIGDDEAALVDQIEAIRLGKRSPEAFDQLARTWLNPASKLCNAHIAREFAEQACQMTDFKVSEFVETLKRCKRAED